MLRRYSSHGLESVDLQAKMTTIGSGNCDLRVPDEHLAPQHAQIDWNSLTRTYWLKDFGTLSGTTCNGEPVYGTVELKTGDMLRFGYGPEYVFELPPIGSKAIQPILTRYRKGTKHPHNVTDNGYAAAVPELPVVIGKSIFNHPQRNTKGLTNGIVLPLRAKQQPLLMFPVNGNGIDKREGFHVPMATNRHGYKSRARSKRSNAFESGTVKSLVRNVQFADSTKPWVTSPSSSGNSSNSTTVDAVNHQQSATFSDSALHDSRVVGSNLLQRVVRLQMELHRRDAEIEQLKELAVLPSTSGARAKQHLVAYRQTVEQAIAERDSMQEQLLQSQELLAKMQNQVVQSQTKRMPTLKQRSTQPIAPLSSQDTSSNESPINLPAYSPPILKQLTEQLNVIVQEIEEHADQYRHPKEVLALKDVNDKMPVESPNSKMLGSISKIQSFVTAANRTYESTLKTQSIVEQWAKGLQQCIELDGLTADTLLQSADDLHDVLRDTGPEGLWIFPVLSALLNSAAVEMKRRRESKSTIVRNSIATQTDHVNNANAVTGDRNTPNTTNQQLERSLADAEETIATLRQQNSLALTRSYSIIEEMNALRRQLTEANHQLNDKETLIEKQRQRLTEAVKEKEQSEQQMMADVRNLHDRIMHAAKSPILLRYRNPGKKSAIPNKPPDDQAEAPPKQVPPLNLNDLENQVEPMLTPRETGYNTSDSNDSLVCGIVAKRIVDAIILQLEEEMQPIAPYIAQRQQTAPANVSYQKHVNHGSPDPEKHVREHEDPQCEKEVNDINGQVSELQSICELLAIESRPGSKASSIELRSSALPMDDVDDARLLSADEALSKVLNCPSSHSVDYHDKSPAERHSERTAAVDQLIHGVNQLVMRMQTGSEKPSYTLPNALPATPVTVKPIDTNEHLPSSTPVKAVVRKSHSFTRNKPTLKPSYKNRAPVPLKLAEFGSPIPQYNSLQNSFDQ